VDQASDARASRDICYVSNGVDINLFEKGIGDTHFKVRAGKMKYDVMSGYGLFQQRDIANVSSHELTGRIVKQMIEPVEMQIHGRNAASPRKLIVN